jgi:hypothetical protein
MWHARGHWRGWSSVVRVGRAAAPGKFRDGRRSWGKPFLPAAGGDHCSGTPASRRAPRVRSTWPKYVGSSLIAVQEARTRETV